MSTKKDLENEIADLKARVAAQARALEAFAEVKGVEITLPPAPHMTVTGDAPYIRGGSKLETHLIPLMCAALEKHGADHRKVGRVVAKARASLRQGGYWHGECTITVPRIWGDIMFEILDAAAAFGRECYAAGHETGSDMLGRLVAGEITADQFEESVEQEKAIRRQERKDFKNLTTNYK